MISFLIPVFNYNCAELVRGLSEQAAAVKRQESHPFDFEIIVADDASTDETLKNMNRHSLSDIAGCRYIELGKNAGRAAIRNFLARQASFRQLVFIDCDAEICSKDFVLSYWNNRDKADIVCGSLKTPAPPPPVGHELRYAYEKAADKRRSTSYRRTHPYECFTTFNVMMNRKVFEKVMFDERCTEYGYEDALLGLMLERENFSIFHSDNALIHGGIDCSTSFIEKTEAALRTLHHIGEPMQSYAGTSRTARKLEKLKIKKTAAQLFLLFRDRLYGQLTGRHPSVFLFQLYKLGYYCTL